MSYQITEIKGTVTLADGSTSEFRIGTEGGWSQWGAGRERLGLTRDAVDAMANGLLEAAALGLQGEDDDEQCPRHGGPWGEDETCAHCTYGDGTPRPASDPGPLGAGAEDDDEELEGTWSLYVAHPGGDVWSEENLTRETALAAALEYVSARCDATGEELEQFGTDLRMGDAYVGGFHASIVDADEETEHGVECDDSTLCPAGDDEHLVDCPRNYRAGVRGTLVLQVWVGDDAQEIDRRRVLLPAIWLAAQDRAALAASAAPSDDRDWIVEALGLLEGHDGPYNLELDPDAEAEDAGKFNRTELRAWLESTEH